MYVSNYIHIGVNDMHLISEEKNDDQHITDKGIVVTDGDNVYDDTVLGAQGELAVRTLTVWFGPQH